MDDALAEARAAQEADEVPVGAVIVREGAVIARAGNRTLRDSELALRQSYGQVRELAGKLLAAQEVERARIARDLHDDFNQQLAALSISISTLRQRRPGDAAELDHALRVLQERTISLTEQVRMFSHDLHPGVLDHVGLVPALRPHINVYVDSERGGLDSALLPASRVDVIAAISGG